jgi:hypothetical protein
MKAFRLHVRAGPELFVYEGTPEPRPVAGAEGRGDVLRAGRAPPPAREKPGNVKTRLLATILCPRDGKHISVAQKK